MNTRINHLIQNLPEIMWEEVKNSYKNPEIVENPGKMIFEMIDFISPGVLSYTCETEHKSCKKLGVL